MSINIREQVGQRLIDGGDINTIINTINGMLAGTATGVYKGTFDGVLGGNTPAAITGTTIAANTSISSAGNLTFTSAASGVVLKQGSNGKCGTFVANGATPVTVNNTSVAITDTIVFSLNTVGGTVGAVPAVKTITAGSGFTVAATASDTSTYNYIIISNAA